MSRQSGLVVAAGLVSVATVAAPGAFAAGVGMQQGSGAFRCGATEAPGLPSEDVATAVDIVCRELAFVSEGVGAFSVSVRPLGGSVVLMVSRAGAPEGRSLVLDGLREVPTAARRLAEAVVRAQAVEETQRVDNLVESEGRELVTRSGTVKFGLGVVGLSAGQGSGTGAGFSLGFAYDTPSFAVPATLRFARSADGEREVGTFAIDTGGRYFLSRRDTSPFVGGGLSVLYLSLSEQGDDYRFYREDSHWGPGLYAEAGLQLLRLHRGRLTASVRADFPLYSLRPEGYEFEAHGEDTRPVRIEESRYLVPITFGLTMSF